MNGSMMGLGLRHANLGGGAVKYLELFQQKFIKPMSRLLSGLMALERRSSVESTSAASSQQTYKYTSTADMDRWE